ncbi:MAG: UDP-N-acetylmuramoyl-tripeptide--D-alanyl-D-alanine ligase [Deltaproteobacteria bacterium]|jgi:UDP-N-acetylmuramoyl-tripeptide--D-alanyl-D-alanine ligase|nr:UDP-N-acetylmuramoyl-tripeptide--D-alanyl-D-alanine ligase [Deltaproteobacteria bacterium]
MATGLKLSEVLAYTRGQWTGRKVSELVFSGVSTDSRTVKPGELFVAVKGKNFDGSDYVEAALKAGAWGAVSDRNDFFDRPVIQVRSGLRALADLARHVRRSKGFKVLAVTGSVGKTTVKEMVRNILRIRCELTAPGREVLATEGNFNNEVGLPLTILAAVRMKMDPAFAVLEMGASAPGDIQYLTEIARPDVGLMTAVGPAHMEKFRDMKTLVRTKGELFKTMGAGALAVVSKADALMVEELGNKSINRLFYGEGGQVWLKQRLENGLAGQKLIFGGPAVDGLQVDLPLVGEHNAFNAVAAAAAAVALDCGQFEIKNGLAQMRPVPGRLAPIQAPKGFWILDDSYNANPASVEAGLRFLKSIPGEGLKGAILGDMLELGPDSQVHHQNLGRLAAELELDFLALSGSQARHTVFGARAAGGRRLKIESFQTPEEAADWVRELLGETGWVLVKGSRAAALERAVIKLQGS